MAGKAVGVWLAGLIRRGLAWHGVVSLAGPPDRSATVPQINQALTSSVLATSGLGNVSSG